MLEKTKEVLNLICNDEIFVNSDIRFVSGTALSYKINHRLSEDLDFATLKLLPNDIDKMIVKYGGEKLAHDKTMEDYVANDGEDINNLYVKYILNGVKIEFFCPPFNIYEVKIWEKDKYTYYENSKLKIASLDTLIYMKTVAFWNRHKYRDLFDIYFVLDKKYITPHKFLNDYIENNITYSVHLYKLIQSTKEFYEKSNDEGINTLVKNPKSYEWYRAEIEKIIHSILLEELYK